MNIEDLSPVMIYDDRCYLCSKFSRIVSFFARKRILIVGHYTETGMKIKSMIFPNSYDSTKMFWFVNEKVAYGGRAAVLPLLLSFFRSKSTKFTNQDTKSECGISCKSPNAVFMRTKSLFSNSKKIILK